MKIKIEELPMNIPEHLVAKAAALMGLLNSADEQKKLYDDEFVLDALLEDAKQTLYNEIRQAVQIGTTFPIAIISDDGRIITFKRITYASDT